MRQTKRAPSTSITATTIAVVARKDRRAPSTRVVAVGTAAATKICEWRGVSLLRRRLSRSGPQQQQRQQRKHQRKWIAFPSACSRSRSRVIFSSAQVHIPRQRIRHGAQRVAVPPVFGILVEQSSPPAATVRQPPELRDTAVRPRVNVRYAA